MLQRWAVIVVCLAALASPLRGQTAADKKATISYLQGLQAPDGGFFPATPDSNTDRAPRSSLRATSSAIRALKYFGGEPSDKTACAKFVASCFDKESGGFTDLVGGKPDVTSTAIGLMAVVELKMPGDPYAEPAVKYLTTNAKGFEDIRIAAAGLEAVAKHPKIADDWLEQVGKMANPDGTFGKDGGKTRETGGAVVVLLRLGGKVENKADVLKALNAGQRKDGAFGKDGTDKSDLESSYRVMRAFMMLKEKPGDVDALRGFIAKCRNRDGGYGVAPNQPSTVSATYFASIILHWLE
ncbi:MAG TPA: prenyltransferase/squalene oxidase repeat-containing protein [Gemmataceae bacterium]|jgi:prenyltransferase beta subunit